LKDALKQIQDNISVCPIDKAVPSFRKRSRKYVEDDGAHLCIYYNSKVFIIITLFALS